MSRAIPNDQIRLLALSVGGASSFRTVPYTLDDLQKLVGGYIEPFRLRDELYRVGLVGLANEDGWALSLPPNTWAARLIPRGSLGIPILLGALLVVRSKDAEFVSLTAADEEVLSSLGLVTEPELEEQGAQRG